MALYGEVVQHTVPVSTIDTAEAVKLTENIFRAVTITLVKELKVVFDVVGIDVWEVIEAVNTKPFGYMPFYRGPGLGGHRIPVDPFYLTSKAREFGLSTRFVELAGEINTALLRYVMARLGEALHQILRRGFTGDVEGQVGQPICSLTTATSLRSSPRRSMVRTKLRPKGA